MARTPPLTVDQVFHLFEIQGEVVFWKNLPEGCQRRRRNYETDFSYADVGDPVAVHLLATNLGSPHLRYAFTSVVIEGKKLSLNLGRLKWCLSNGSWLVSNLWYKNHDTTDCRLANLSPTYINYRFQP